VNKLLNFLEPELKKIRFNPNQQYLRHETRISAEQHKNINVIAIKGKRAVTSLVSAERGRLITVIICINAVGHFVPLLVVFPQQNMQTELISPFMPVIYRDGSKLISLHIVSGLLFQSQT
jgi:hypothetical protein